MLSNFGNFLQVLLDVKAEEIYPNYVQMVEYINRESIEPTNRLMPTKA